MFVASEAAFSAAALADPKLLEDAARERVVIATPATMVALLQAVGLAWREATLSERAEQCASWRSTSADGSPSSPST
jgi:DNA recombination protein RmuC